MQRFKVHSHSQAVFPYLQEPTTSSLQYHTPITSVEPYLSLVNNLPIIGRQDNLSIETLHLFIQGLFDYCTLNYFCKEG